MRETFDTDGMYDEYAFARNHLLRCLRQGRMAEAKGWLTVAERVLAMQARLDELRVAHDRRAVLREEFEQSLGLKR